MSGECTVIAEVTTCPVLVRERLQPDLAYQQIFQEIRQELDWCHDEVIAVLANFRIDTLNSWLVIHLVPDLNHRSYGGWHQL